MTLSISPRRYGTAPALRGTPGQQVVNGSLLRRLVTLLVTAQLTEVDYDSLLRLRICSASSR